jgi:hypothetical protein
MTEVNFQLSDVERLATTLDAVDLNDSDRATLHAVFALAGQAAAAETEDEVSGFSAPSISSGLFGSFQLGGTSGGTAPSSLLLQTAHSQLLQTQSGIEQSMSNTDSAITANIKQ